jgi:SNF2 family DNA or RNA helicase
MQAQQGVGVNLQIADEIWFYTMDSSYINYVQMIHRAWRKGRTDKVIIRIFMYDGSLEEGIWNAVQKKIGIADAFFDILKKIRAELS